MFDAETVSAAERVLDAARAAGLMIVTAESCTGGLVAGALTAIPGSSDAVDGGTITYSNEAKVRLGVPQTLIEEHGAVSEQVARAMAEAARRRAGEPGRAALAAVSVTGVAGPGGGTATKPVGLVHFAAASETSVIACHEHFGEVGRDEVRRRSVVRALALLESLLLRGD